MRLSAQKQRPRHPSQALLRKHDRKKYSSTTLHLRWFLGYIRFGLIRQEFESQINLDLLKSTYLLFILGQNTWHLHDLSNLTIKHGALVLPFLHSTLSVSFQLLSTEVMAPPATQWFKLKTSQLSLITPSPSTPILTLSLGPNHSNSKICLESIHIAPSSVSPYHSKARSSFSYTPE